MMTGMSALSSTLVGAGIDLFKHACRWFIAELTVTDGHMYLHDTDVIGSALFMPKIWIHHGMGLGGVGWVGQGLWTRSGVL